MNDFTRVKLSHGVDLGTKLRPPVYPRVRAREWVRAWRACTSSLRACTASMAQGGRVHSSGTSSTSLWSIHARRSRQRLHMCHVASWTVREALCSVPLEFNLRVLHILKVLGSYTCIARIRFGNQIMNKYHTIACKLWVIYAWCSPSFNSYSSSHSKSISFYKKAKNAGIGKTWDYSGTSSWILQDCTSVWLCIKKRRILSKRFEWMGCFLWNLVQMNHMEKFLWFTILRIKQPR